MDFKKILETEEYSFLRDNPHLGSNVILLTLGGSYAYGTNTPESDVDIRGAAIWSPREILKGKGFEQVVNEKTDTTVYSLEKLIGLLANVNPNTIEMLGCKPEHYLYISPIGQLLMENKELFLSKKCINSFGGYANAQLQRLNNKAVRVVSQEDREKHILRTVYNTMFMDQYKLTEDDIKLYVDKTNTPDMESEIFMDINLRHYPLRDYAGMQAGLANILRDYDKLGHRNKNAINHKKLGKHMMHLVRLYLMCFDILEKGEINTYREKDREFLMSIRNGKYLDENNQPVPEFFDIVDEFENKLEILKKKSDLPPAPDYDKIDDLLIFAHQMQLSNMNIN